MWETRADCESLQAGAERELLDRGKVNWRFPLDGAVDLSPASHTVTDLSGRRAAPCRHVHRVGDGVPAGHPAHRGDAPAGSVSAAARPEEAGRRAAAAAQRGRVPTGLHQPGAQVLPLGGAAAGGGTPHHHGHLSALDAWPHPPDDASAAGACGGVLEVAGRCQRRARPVLRGRFPRVWRENCRTRQGKESDVLPVCVRRRLQPRDSRLLHHLHSGQLKVGKSWNPGQILATDSSSVLCACELLVEEVNSRLTLYFCIDDEISNQNSRLFLFLLHLKKIEPASVSFVLNLLITNWSFVPF